MNRIVQCFPTTILEARITDYENINQILKKELVEMFDDPLVQKRALSHEWEDFKLNGEKHKTGYSNFTIDGNLIKKENFKFFFDHIEKLITSFFAELNYFDRWHFVNSWSAVYPTGAWVPLHDHKVMEWSGAYYVSAPQNCGDIKFTDPREYALVNEPPMTLYRGNQKHQITPQDGTLLLFPGYLKHETLPNQSQEDRIIISFNINTGENNIKYPHL